MAIRRVFGKVIHDFETYGAACEDSEKHKEWIRTQEWGKECGYCHTKWYESLPWARSSFETRRYDNDESLMSLLQIDDDARKKKRLSVVYRNCWEHMGAGYENYISELLGIETGELKDPDSYPYWRISKKAKPNLIIPVLRQRICYEPQMKECPVYLEIVYSGFNQQISIHGLNTVEDISMSHLNPILQARDWLVGKDRMEMQGSVKSQHGGARNVKVANQPKDIKKALGEKYEELRGRLTNVKQDAKTAAEYFGQDWRSRILDKYPILENHPDLVEEIDPHKVPSNPEATDGEMAPWQISAEIAARETIPNYTPKSVSGETLRKHAIFPDKEKE